MLTLRRPQLAPPEERTLRSRSGSQTRSPTSSGCESMTAISTLPPAVADGRSGAEPSPN
jgi:hypothetical protein